MVRSVQSPARLILGSQYLHLIRVQDSTLDPSACPVHVTYRSVILTGSKVTKKLLDPIKHPVQLLFMAENIAKIEYTVLVRGT